MFSTILEAVTPKFISLNKKAVLKSKTFLFNSLENEVLPALDVFISSNIKALSKNKFLSNSFSLMGIKSSNSLDGVKELRNMFQDIMSYEQKMDKLILNMNNVLLDKNTSLKDGTLVRVIEDLTFMSLYVLDFLYYSILDESDTNFTKMKIEVIKNELPEFIKLVKYYNRNIKNILDEILELPDVPVSISQTDSSSMLDTFLKKIKKISFIPTANGFVGNPIYHFRMWLVDREIRKYEALKDRKEALELRLMELRYQESGSTDENIKERIAYFEEKISKIEYEIAKIEKED